MPSTQRIAGVWLAWATAGGNASGESSKTGPRQSRTSEARVMVHSAYEAPPVDESGSLLPLQQEVAADEDSASALRPLAIILTVIDDWGYGDVAYHDPVMHTPELSMLASSGVVLEQFYAACTCTPSRAMLMTGRYNIRNGMQDSVLHSTEPRGVPLDERFLSQKLHEAGYATAGVGKWHLGMVRTAYLPERRGFEKWYGIYTGGGSHTGHFSVSQPFTVRGDFGSSEPVIWKGYNLWEDLQPSVDNHGATHTTHLYTRKAAEYISEFRSADRPWFVYVSYQAVHDPIEVGDDRYVHDTSCANATAFDADVANRPTLCGMVAEVDDGLKTIRLTTGDDWARTLMVVVSDNGGVKAHGSSNLPFRGEKGTYYEGGIRVPCVLAGGYVSSALAVTGRQSLVSSSLSHLVDLHATLLDAAGYEPASADKAHDGVSLLPHLFGGSLPPRRDLLINLNSDLFGGSGAVRSGAYKLVVNPEPNEAAIYATVRKALAAHDTNIDAGTLDTIVAQAHAQVLGWPAVCLFDIEQNPAERDDGACENLAQCANLYDLPEYGDIRDRLQALWDDYKHAAAPSTFAWEDDGPLADPALFGGYWSPWRDGDDHPKAHYLGTAALRDSKGTDCSQPAATFVAVAGSEAISLLHSFLLVGLVSFSLGALVSAKVLGTWWSPWHQLP